MDEQHLSKYFSAIYRKSKREFSNRFELDKGINATQGDVLMFIHEHPNQQQKAIAEQMAIDSSLLVRNLKALEARGLVVRVKDDDLRANRVRLTAEGETLALGISKQMSEWWQDFFKSMPEIDLKQFSDYLYQTYEKMRTLDR